MSGMIMPGPWFTGLDDSGRPLVGGKLYTYAAGTSQLQATFTDVGLSVANPNPLILDGGGRGVAFLQPLSYKFVLKDANDVTIKSQDNITAPAPFSVDLDIAGVAGEALPGGSVVYLSIGAGGKTAGRWYLADADNDYASLTADFIAMVQTSVLGGAVGAFRLQGRTSIPGPPLTVGATYFVSTTPGGIVTPAPVGSPPYARVIGIADSPSTLVSATGLGTNTVLSGNASVAGDLSVGGTLTVGGAASFGGPVQMTTNVQQALTVATPTNDAHVIVVGNVNNSIYLGVDNNVGGILGTGPNAATVATFGPQGLGLLVFDPAASIRFYTGGLQRGMIHPSGSFSWAGTVDASPGGTFMVGPGPNSPGGENVMLLPNGQIYSQVLGVGFMPHMAFGNGTGTVGSITTNGATCSFNTSSDARLKTDLGLPDETAILPRLVIHDFQWKATGVVSRGLFAQEAAAVLPEAVTVGCEGPEVDEPWQVDYSKLVPDLVVGWQQHERVIADLRAEVTNLRDQLLG